MVTATFLTEDSYLGNSIEPLTLNRYNYCVSSYVNYTDPIGNVSVALIPEWVREKALDDAINEVNKIILVSQTDATSGWDYTVAYSQLEVVEKEAQRIALEDSLASALTDNGVGQFVTENVIFPVFPPSGMSYNLVSARENWKGNYDEQHDKGLNAAAQSFAGSVGTIYGYLQNAGDPSYAVHSAITTIDSAQNLVLDLAERAQNAPYESMTALKPNIPFSFLLLISDNTSRASSMFSFNAKQYAAASVLTTDISQEGKVI